PVWRMLSASAGDLETRARAIAARLQVDVCSSRSAIGGGSLPGQTQPSWAVALRGSDSLAAVLRRSDPPVIGRIDEQRVLLDVRSVLPEQDAALEAAVKS